VSGAGSRQRTWRVERDDGAGSPVRADGVQHARTTSIAKVHRQVLRLARLQNVLDSGLWLQRRPFQVPDEDADVLTGAEGGMLGRHHGSAACMCASWMCGLGGRTRNHPEGLLDSDGITCTRSADTSRATYGMRRSDSSCAMIWPTRPKPAMMTWSRSSPESCSVGCSACGATQ
jgi:hypothetical protein